MEPGHYDRPINDNEVMSVKDWLITLLIMIIPCVNIIMLFVWAFSNNGNENRKSWARAYLIFLAVGIVLYILLMLVAGAAIFAMLGSLA